MTKEEQKTIVLAYFSVWSENDADRRAALLDECWHEFGEIHIGDRRIAGRQEVEAEAARFRQSCPDDRGALTSEIQFVGRWFLFAAEVHRPDGSVYSKLLDVGEFAEDGRIGTIVTFARA